MQGEYLSLAGNSRRGSNIKSDAKSFVYDLKNHVIITMGQPGGEEPKLRKRKDAKQKRNFAFRGAYSPQHIRKKEALAEKKKEVSAKKK